MPYRASARGARRGDPLRHRRLHGAARQGAGRGIAGTTLQAELRRRRAAGELVGAGIAMFVEKSGLGPADGVKIAVDTSGAVEVVTGGASIGQGFETVMAQVCRRDPRRRLSPGARHPRPDRSHRVRHRRPRLARDGDDRRRDPRRGAQAARQGARHGGAAPAGGARRSRHRRRRRAAQGRRRRLDPACGESPPRCCRPRRRSPTASPGFPPKAGSRSSGRSTPMASTSRWCRSMPRPGRSRSSAT